MLVMTYSMAKCTDRKVEETLLNDLVFVVEG